MYPGGAIKDNHTIATHDVLLMMKHRPQMKRLLNHPNLHLLASFNGLDYSRYPSHEHVNRAFFFTGVALGKDSYDSITADTGIATLIGGVYTVNVDGPHPFHPGDQIMWEAPRLPARGKTGVSYREWNVGTPTTRRPPVLVPYRAMDNHTILAGTRASIERSSANGTTHPGIKNLTLARYYRQAPQPNRQMRYNTSSQDEAMGIQYGLLSQGLFMMFGLLRTGNFPDKDEMPAEAAGRFIKRVANNLGIFAKNRSETQDTALYGVLDYMYGPNTKDLPNSGWENVKGDYRKAFITGADAKGNPKRLASTLDANLYTMAHDSMGMLMDTAEIGAHERQSRIIGVCQNYAEPGQGATIVFGTNN